MKNRIQANEPKTDDADGNALTALEIA